LLELDLNRDVNVFFGVNGSGKTSLLRILHSAMQNDLSLLHRVPFKTAEVVVYSMEYDQEFTMSAIMPESVVRRRTKNRGAVDDTEDVVRGPAAGPTGPKEEEWTVSPAASERGIWRSWRHQYLPTQRLYFPLDERPPLGYLKPTRGLSAEDTLDAFFADAVDRQWHYYTAQVLVPSCISQNNVA
jgi:energy-coupling factor transporter ATP-binding protein EcfA2